MKNLIEETFSAIRDDYSAALVSLDMDTFESEYGGRAFASIENSTQQDDSFIPPILRGWPVVENLTHEAWIDFNKTDEHNFPNVGINFEFQALTNSLEMKISPYFTRTNDGEQVFIEDKMAQFSFAKDIQPKELAAHVSEILTTGQKLTSLETKDELGQLNEQLDAIRKDPLLILDAPDETFIAAQNVNIHLDWMKSDQVFDSLLEKADNDRYSVDATPTKYADNASIDTINYVETNDAAYEISLREEFEEHRSLNMLMAKHGDITGILEFDKSMLIEFRDSLSDTLKNHSPITAKDRFFFVPKAGEEIARLDGLLPSTSGDHIWKLPPTIDLSELDIGSHFEEVSAPKAKDVFFAVPIADTKLAQDSGLEVVQVGVWKLPASMQQGLDGSEKGQQEPRDLFSQIDFTEKPKSISKDTGIEM